MPGPPPLGGRSRRGPSGSRSTARGCGGVWEGETMAAEPGRAEIQAFFRRLRAAPANKVTGGGEGRARGWGSAGSPQPISASLCL